VWVHSLRPPDTGPRHAIFRPIHHHYDGLECHCAFFGTNFHSSGLNCAIRTTFITHSTCITRGVRGCFSGIFGIFITRSLFHHILSTKFDLSTSCDEDLCVYTRHFREKYSCFDGTCSNIFGTSTSTSPGTIDSISSDDVDYSVFPGVLGIVWAFFIILITFSLLSHHM
jgi:hypothetical protein